jgi:pantothenate kinase
MHRGIYMLKNQHYSNNFLRAQYDFSYKVDIDSISKKNLIAKEKFSKAVENQEVGVFHYNFTICIGIQ